MELRDIREQIDEVDAKIRKLFVRRMKLAKEVARVKALTDDEIYKPERERAMLETGSDGLPEDLAAGYRALLKRIMEISRGHQYLLTLRMKNCFPFSFETGLPSYGRIGIKQDEYDCLKDQIQEEARSFDTFSSYADIGKALKDGRIDAGMGVMETVGGSVNDELHKLLLTDGLYINRCDVIDLPGGYLKTVTFSERLVFRPEHNRIRIMFTAANRTGIPTALLFVTGEYDVNITHIHSMPYRDDPDNPWNYRFFAELEMNGLQEASQALLYQLYKETQQFRLLGSYLYEGDF